MKRLLTITGCLIFTMCVFTLTAAAQGQMRRDDGYRQGQNRQGGYGYTMYGQNLDDESMQALDEIHQEFRQPMNQLSWKLMRARAELGELLSAQDPDRDIVLRKAEDVAELLGERYMLRVKMQLKMLDEGLDPMGGFGMGMGNGMMNDVMPGRGMMRGRGYHHWNSDQGGY